MFVHSSAEITLFLLKKRSCQNYKFDVFTISESMLDSSVSDLEIEIPGYSIHTEEGFVPIVLQSYTTGGVVCAYVLQSYKTGGVVCAYVLQSYKTEGVVCAYVLQCTRPEEWFVPMCCRATRPEEWFVPMCCRATRPKY